MTRKMDRRDFVKSIAASGTVAMTGWPALAEVSYASPPAVYKVFTPSQAVTVGAIANQIIPADDYPGGETAGVVQFIDNKLAGPYGEFYKDRYESGLKLVDELSEKHAAGSFVSLSFEQQGSVLKILEEGTGEDPSGAEFFRLILDHAFEGYYGDPEHGANRGGASWKMIGFGG